MTDTHIHTPMPTLDLTCAQTHSHISGALLSQRFHYTHTRTSSSVLEIYLIMTHPCPRLMACTNTYLSFTFTIAFPLHACCVTRNWCIRPFKIGYSVIDSNDENYATTIGSFNFFFIFKRAFESLVFRYVEHEMIALWQLYE